MKRRSVDRSFSLYVLVGLSLALCVSAAVATTPPAPGVEMPEHVRKFIRKTQVSIDTPGAWRGKAKLARDERRIAAQAPGGIAASFIGGVLQGTLSVPTIVVAESFKNAPGEVPLEIAPDGSKPFFDLTPERYVTRRIGDDVFAPLPN